jgi:Serine carboxypeptidase
MLVNYKQYTQPGRNLAKADDEELSLNEMMRNRVHPALKLPENVRFGSQSGAVFDTLAGDFMKPVVDVVAKVLNETSVKVVVYSGQLDLICSTPGTVEWINAMNWYGKKQYARAPRRDIRVNRVLEGYVRQYGNFSMYWVSLYLVSYIFVFTLHFFQCQQLNRAGHMAPVSLLFFPFFNAYTKKI